MTAEAERLENQKNKKQNWRRWGPYLSERQWGTVREDYSADGNAWGFLPHDHARSRAYRWGEDGLAGFSDDHQRLCFSLALWNGRDPILKERLFGLTNNEGSHGEDVKELYYYLDATPSHSYLKFLYKYPHAAFPYAELVERNAGRPKDQGEYELIDTGVFDDDRYFDVFVEFAKGSDTDTFIRITAENRGPDAASLVLLPQILFRNLWAWTEEKRRPSLELKGDHLLLKHRNLPRTPEQERRDLPEASDDLQRLPALGDYFLYADGPDEWLFTENETNQPRLFGQPAAGPFKDAFHDYVVRGDRTALAGEPCGTKAGALFRTEIPSGASRTVRLRLCSEVAEEPFRKFEKVFEKRIREADEFYRAIPCDEGLTCEEQRRVQRQALAGMIWTKQYYYYDVPQWLQGDKGQPEPPPERLDARNTEWKHINSANVISMPDKWEYPWFAAWDLGFHALPLAMVDAEFAKEQLETMTREWFMHPNGQLAAYEWNFGDVNPPVHAWATWRVFEIDREQRGDEGDLAFLETVFHKLMLNFTWWVNRKDASGRNIFQGGFLGLDNIGVFDRSAPLPTDGYLNQADGTSWMAMYSLNLMRIAIELAQQNPVYEGIATKFFEHFLHIAEAMTNMAGAEIGLWDEQDGFYYDELALPGGTNIPLRVRSMVGLIPLFAVEVLKPSTLNRLPRFKENLVWFLRYRPDLADLVSHWEIPGRGDLRLLSLLRGHRMKCLLRRVLDETEFLSDYGVRALSKVYDGNPYRFPIDGRELTVDYQPAESMSGMFGGNSNWRGPIWMPVNYLLIESIRRFHDYYGDDFRVEYPIGSSETITLREVADLLSERLIRIFLPDRNGIRPVFNGVEKMQADPHFRDHLLFYEYFHGDNGRGVGASHQTGWTGLVAKLIADRGCQKPD